MGVLSGKVAIVTGANSGIGRAAALLFAKEGARLVLSARRGKELDQLVNEIAGAGGAALAVAGNVSDESLARELVDVAVNRFGGLDIAFNNAGVIGCMKPVAEMTLAEWQETLDINLTGAFLGAKYQAPAMRARGAGSLLFTSSFVGYTAGMPHMAAYAASKAGMIGLVKALGAELGPQGIRVNAVVPGGTDTPMSFTNAPDASPEVGVFVRGLHALGRLADPREIAQAALFLASDAASFVTGSAMLVDGGVSINRT